MKAYAPIFDKSRFQFNYLSAAIIVAIALASLADWMFYRHYPGISYPLFFIAIALGAIAANPAEIKNHDLAKAIIVLTIALLPSIEALDFLSGLIGFKGLIAFTLIINQKLQGDILAGLRNMRRLVSQLFWRLFSDINRHRKVSKRLRPNANAIAPNFLKLWALPIVLSFGFFILFLAANPLIEIWIEKIDIPQFLMFLTQIDFYRVIFWIVMLSFCWPFIRFKMRNSAKAKIKTNDAANKCIDNEAMIFRALLLFNIVFAMQTILDVTYLWGGISLPEGISHASYAHRGAYTLIFTALLAALFVLIATRTGTTSASSSRVKALIIFWIGQNVMLVLSSVLRLDLYVEAFSLTYLRIWALIWMALVGIGLILIIVKIWQSRTSVWLIKTNLIALGLILYMTSLPNLDYIIADYNVSSAASNEKKVLDVVYLASLGENALPAVDRVLGPDFNSRMNFRYGRTSKGYEYLVECRRVILAQFIMKSEDWRAWSFRSARLQKYIDGHQLKNLKIPNEL